MRKLSLAWIIRVSYTTIILTDGQYRDIFKGFNYD